MLHLAQHAHDVARRAAAHRVAQVAEDKLCAADSAAWHRDLERHRLPPPRAVVASVLHRLYAPRVELLQADVHLIVLWRWLPRARLRTPQGVLDVGQVKVLVCEEVINSLHLVVFPPRGLMAEHLVRLLELGEKCRCRRSLFVALGRHFVRVILQRETPEGAPNLARRGGAIKPQQLIVVFLAAVYLRSLA